MDFFEKLVLYVVLFFVTFIIIAICLDQRRRSKIKEKKDSIDIHMQRKSNFSTTQKVLGDSGKGIAIDNVRKKICLIDNSKMQLDDRIISYNDLLASEIYEDGNTISRTERSTPIGRALVGGALFGGAGAVVGGLSGNSKTTNETEINKIGLRLFINNQSNPVFELQFNDVSITKNSGLYNKYSKLAQEWHGLMKVLIKQAGIDDKTINLTKNKTLKPSSIADEINKLVKLRESGTLTEDEFKQMKTNLINKSIN